MECKSAIAWTGFGKFIELIDTLWNVNPIRIKATAIAIRINRYIMECKWRNLLQALMARYGN